MSSNQLEDRIRLPPMPEMGASGLDQGSKVGPFMMKTHPEPGVVTGGDGMGSATAGNGARR